MAIGAVTVVGQFLNQTLVHAQHRGLGGRVVGQIGHPNVTRAAGQGDDVTFASAEHDGQQESE